MSDDALLEYITEGTDDRLFAITELFRRDADIGVICDATRIDMLFLEKLKNIVSVERRVAASPFSAKALYLAKRTGFSDGRIARAVENR